MSGFPRRAVLKSAVAAGFAGALTLTSAGSSHASPRTRTVVVYGGTPSGIAAAIAVVRAGIEVVLVLGESPLGGMMTNGLGRSDVANKSLISGLADSFFRRVGGLYGQHNAIYNFEPHIAQAAFTSMLEQYRIMPRPGVVNSVIKAGTRLTGVVLADGSTIKADVFIDASYEGILLQESGVTTTYGRESRKQYGESRAGFGYHQNAFAMKTTTSSGALLPGLALAPMQAIGSADSKIMPFNYRLCVTNDLSNAVRFAKTPGYDPAQFELLSRGLAASVPFTWRAWWVAGHKFDLNGGGFFDTDLIWGSWGFPTATLAGRKAIAAAHRTYAMDLLYFMGNDPSVPSAVREQVQQYGLAKDEFTATSNWPAQLYIRESVRMIGATVMTEADLLSQTRKPDSVAVGAYAIDSHTVQRFVDHSGKVVLEGTLTSADVVTGYEIPFGAMLPRASEASNLISALCISASHVAWSSIRVEPTFMAIGEAAGEAAAQAAKSGASVQSLSISDIQSRLVAHAALIRI